MSWVGINPISSLPIVHLIALPIYHSMAICPYPCHLNRLSLNIPINPIGSRP